ncbi:alanine racemase [Ferrimonas balearica DSM 9799]|uniref:Alanine racemase n=1 Tax=Ferrimonas balearica (strain DSM 9799 / CCM 4581 / KCTC 23876 / PAT) TaxID=550540 RepID=E1SWP5_FERBD|nr:alanine racemase [Ferrimonas balearica]ADN77507.1 alanine racemase [Ferrimonas balearica DSM 9799]MBY5980611.1 alanine racemase [Ferrimonas balearica]
MRFSPVAEIRRSALNHNLQRLRALAPNSKLMAVVKANAYGHGLIRLASWMSDVDGFGLARIEEALALRESGSQARLVLLEGVFSAEDLEQAAQHELDVVIHDAEQVRLLEHTPLSQPLTIWLKIDTGMHRLGVTAEQFSALYQRLCQCDNVRTPPNLMTHFSVADELENPETVRQIQRFNQLAQNLPGEKALSNSAGTLSWPSAHGDWVRPGLALYGVNPMIGGRAEQFDLKPVMTMRSKVLAVRELKAGEPVGYGQTWRSSRDTRIAVIAMGYGDGYPRHAVSGTPVLINGQRYPLAGRISMDMLTVEVGEAPVQVGDDVVLWGDGLPVEEIAECAGTIPYELLCSTTARVQYRYID